MYAHNLHAHPHLCNGQVAYACDTHTKTSMRERARNNTEGFSKSITPRIEDAVFELDITVFYRHCANFSPPPFIQAVDVYATEYFCKHN